MIIFKYKEKLLFLACGGFAAFVNFLSRILFSSFLDLYISIIFAYILGMITAYYLFKNFVFVSLQGNKGGSPLSFVFVNVIALLQIYLVTVLSKDIFYKFFDNEYLYLAHGLAILTSVFSSYWLHKNFTFIQK
ncbi:MAG: GtrA family protein [Methylophilaceae bacterium]|jgi:putative flippase GtrA